MHELYITGQNIYSLCEMFHLHAKFHFQRAFVIRFWIQTQEYDFLIEKNRPLIEKIRPPIEKNRPLNKITDVILSHIK